MSCYKKTMVFALINLFIFAFPAVAYYQPQEGRFMQRDPLGVNPAGGTQNPFAIQKQYSEGLNISEYVRSNPLQYKDALGLCSFNVFGPGISDTSRTITLPDGSIGEAVGEAMITKWDFTVMIWPLPLTMTPLSMIVPRTCEAEVSYWYMRSDDNSHKNHEEGHVFNARVGWTLL